MQKRSSQVEPNVTQERDCLVTQSWSASATCVLLLSLSASLEPGHDPGSTGCRHWADLSFFVRHKVQSEFFPDSGVAPSTDGVAPALPTGLFVALEPPIPAVPFHSSHPEVHIRCWPVPGRTVHHVPSYWRIQRPVNRQSRVPFYLPNQPPPLGHAGCIQDLGQSSRAGRQETCTDAHTSLSSPV
jgi:hypothetical protein